MDIKIRKNTDKYALLFRKKIERCISKSVKIQTNMLYFSVKR